MIKTLFALSAAAIVATSPLAARTKAEPAPAPTASSAAIAKPTPQKRYCVDSVFTGSRIPKRTCMTRDQWLAEGFDPAAK